MTLTFFALLVVLSGCFAPHEQRLGWMLVWSLFGASAAAILTSLGGNPVTPALAMLPFVMWSWLRLPHPTWRPPHVAGPSAAAGVRPMGPTFWLGLCIAWGALTALFMPRLLSGSTQVYTTQKAVTGKGLVQLLPLQPSSGNVTQLGYAMAGLLCFVCARQLASLPDGLQRLRQAMSWLAALLLLSVLLNLGETYGGLDTGLSLVRNGGYAVMVGGEQGGLQRITGPFSEASAFASFTLPVFAFHASLWLQGERGRACGTVALWLLLVILMATSSTGYVALGLYATGLVALRLPHVLAPSALRLWRSLAILGLLGLVVLAAAALFRQGAADKLLHFFNTVLGQKLQSSSGMERMQWNLQGLRNLVDSYGLGVGLGSTRASSYLIMLLANLGVIGTLLYAAFVWQVFTAPRGPADPEAERIRTAFRHAFAAALCAAVVSGTVFDRGQAFFVYAAAASVVWCAGCNMVPGQRPAPPTPAWAGAPA